MFQLQYTTEFNTKESKIKIKYSNKDLCWFCGTKCFEFVKICKNCKYEKIKKQKN